jgi:hypothetical protein
VIDASTTRQQELYEGIPGYGLGDQPFIALEVKRLSVPYFERFLWVSHSRSLHGRLVIESFMKSGIQRCWRRRR